MTFKVHDEGINSYGFWIKTSGIDFSRFEKNPIMLYNHNQAWRGNDDEVLPIGSWDNLKVDKDGSIFMDANIDDEDDFSQRIAKKVEKKVLRATSIGIIPLAWSEDPADLKPGQLYPTITKCILREVSIVDIPSNANAVALYDEAGTAINLNDSGAIPMPKLAIKEEEIIIPPNPNKMDFKEIALAMGLTETAQSADIQLAYRKKVDEVTALKAEVTALSSQLTQQKKDEAISLVDNAIKDGRIKPEQKANILELFDKSHDSTKSLLATMVPTITLAGFAGGDVPGAGQTGVVLHDGKTFKQLQKENPKALQALKLNDVEKFKLMFKQDFGMDAPAGMI